MILNKPTQRILLRKIVFVFFFFLGIASRRTGQGAGFYKVCIF